MLFFLYLCMIFAEGSQQTTTLVHSHHRLYYRLCATQHCGMSHICDIPVRFRLIVVVTSRHSLHILASDGVQKGVFQYFNGKTNINALYTYNFNNRLVCIIIIVLILLLY